MKVLPTLFLLTLTSLALAQRPAREVEFNLTQVLVRSEGPGKPETLMPDPQTVTAGDLLQEDLTVTNVSGRNLSHVTVSVPVTNGTRLAATPRASGQWVTEYSADGGRTYRKSTSQATTSHAAPTHVRWTVAHLSPDESLKLSFRVRVN